MLKQKGLGADADLGEHTLLEITACLALFDDGGEHGLRHIGGFCEDELVQKAAEAIDLIHRERIVAFEYASGEFIFVEAHARRGHENDTLDLFGMCSSHQTGNHAAHGVTDQQCRRLRFRTQEGAESFSLCGGAVIGTGEGNAFAPAGQVNRNDAVIACQLPHHRQPVFLATRIAMHQYDQRPLAGFQIMPALAGHGFFLHFGTGQQALAGEFKSKHLRRKQHHAGHCHHGQDHDYGQQFLHGCTASGSGAFSVSVTEPLVIG